MSRRLRAFLRGEPEANPGDYVLALVAVAGLFVAVSVKAIF